MFGKSRLEMKVGIFVFVATIVLIIFVLLIGDFKNLASAYKVRFVFSFINGVKIGAPIRFAGVDVGQIREIRLIPNPQEQATKVELVGLIRKSIKIPVDSDVWVNTLGLLGEKYVDVMPGKDYNNFIRDGGMMVGQDPVPMHELGELAKSIAQKLDMSIDDIRMVANSIASFSRNLDDGITKIKNTEGTVGKLLYDDAIYNDLEALVADIKKHPWKLFMKGKEAPEPKVRKQ